MVVVSVPDGGWLAGVDTCWSEGLVNDEESASLQLKSVGNYIKKKSPRSFSNFRQTDMFFFSLIYPAFHEESQNTTLHKIHPVQRVAAS